MNWKQLVLGTATVTLLAACASTKPADTTAGTQQPTAPQTTAPVDTGSSNQNQVAVDPLNDPNSPLAKRSVFRLRLLLRRRQRQAGSGNPLRLPEAERGQESHHPGNTDARGVPNTTWRWASAAPKA